MSVLVDTSIWVDHLRGNEPQLSDLLKAGRVCVHTLVIGELACGNFNNRAKRLSDWNALPSASESKNSHILQYIEDRKLMGRGIGLIDAHLLFAAENDGDLQLWTRDGSLHSIAEELGVAYVESP